MYKVKYADRSFYSQRNNPIDIYNKILGYSDYLESCMASAVTNACIALLPEEPEFKVYIDFKNSEDRITKIPFQPEQLGWNLLNDVNNWPELRKLRNLTDEDIFNEHIVPSRVPQYMPYIAKVLFGIESTFKYSNIKEIFDLWIDNIIQGISNVILFNNPGHYVAIVKYDEIKDILIYHDSANGKNKILTREETIKNVANWYVEFYPPKE